MVRWLACLVLLACVPRLMAQGNLNRLHAQMADPPTAPKPATPTPVSGPAQQADTSIFPETNDGADNLALAFGAALLATAPIWLPAVLLGDNLVRPGYFPGHPYAHDRIPFIDSGDRQSSQAEIDWFDPARYKPWSVRLGAENGNDFGGVNRLGGRLAIDTASRFGLTTNWDSFHERLPGGGTDEALLGDVNFVYRFAQADWILMHAGLGGRILTGRGGLFGGFNFVYGADIFPVDPLVISAQVDLGTLHESFVVRARATVGWQIKHLELFGGYDFLRIGSVNFQGPLLGARLWF